MSSGPPHTGPPPTRTIAGALNDSAPLARLLQRARESRQRFDVIVPLLPPGLRETVRPGPLDDEGWSLLVAHGAAAAKLRQLLPRLEDALRNEGWPSRALKVRIQPPGTVAGS
jgi:hypothetical protein